MGTCTTLAFLLNISLLSIAAEEDSRYGSLIAASMELQDDAVESWFDGGRLAGLFHPDDRQDVISGRSSNARGRFSKALWGGKGNFRGSPFAFGNPGLPSLGGAGGGGGSRGGAGGRADRILPPRDDADGEIKNEDIDAATKIIGQPEPTSLLVWLAVVLMGARAANERQRF